MARHRAQLGLECRYRKPICNSLKSFKNLFVSKIILVIVQLKLEGKYYDSGRYCCFCSDASFENKWHYFSLNAMKIFLPPSIIYLRMVNWLQTQPWSFSPFCLNSAYAKARSKLHCLFFFQPVLDVIGERITLHSKRKLLLGATPFLKMFEKREAPASEFEIEYGFEKIYFYEYNCLRSFSAAFSSLDWNWIFRAIWHTYFRFILEKRFLFLCYLFRVRSLEAGNFSDLDITGYHWEKRPSL